MISTIDAVAARAVSHPAAALDEEAWLGAAIDDDREGERFTRWGWSTVIDENTGSPVIDRPLFDALHERAGIPAQWPVGNAGVLHVYGYLLSTAPTPYGLKRERYLDGALARAYGLDGDEFVPWARASTLLSRVTDAASDLLARTPARTVNSGGVLALDRATDVGAWALAYAVDGLLVTTFPVASPDTVLAEWGAAPARLRWNAVRAVRADGGAAGKRPGQYQPVDSE